MILFPFLQQQMCRQFESMALFLYFMATFTVYMTFIHKDNELFMQYVKEASWKYDWCTCYTVSILEILRQIIPNLNNYLVVNYYKQKYNVSRLSRNSCDWKRVKFTFLF